MRAPKTPFRFARRDVVSVLVAVGIVSFARSSLADHYQVPTGSMVPTVAVQDRVLVNKLAYGLRVPLSDVYLLRFAEPSRGDVVVLDSPESRDVLLKRIVAVPGDHVVVDDGLLVLNGKPVPVVEGRSGPVEQLGAHPHRVDFHDGGGPSFGPAIVPEDQFLVMGDNRGNSHDGRMFGFVERQSILGHVSGVFLRDGHFSWIPL